MGSKDLERSQLKDRIFEAMQHISPEQRQIVLLREVEGYSYKEISETMDIPEGTVMSRLFYARRKLQELLRSEVMGES
jgi:RNA polymerase sigma-70 factor (ECF subfamily)